METVVEVKVPDIGDFKDVDVIEVMVKPGDVVGVDDPLIAIESEKATMEVPAPQGGQIKKIAVKIGDKVSEGSLILTLEAAGEARAGAAAEAPDIAAEAPAPPPAAAAAAPAKAAARPAAAARRPPTIEDVAAASPVPEAVAGNGAVHKAHASPAVRKFARELGVDISQVRGSGLHGRVFRADVQKFVGEQLARPKAASAGLAGMDLLPWPRIDFAKFGEFETTPLSRIRRLSKTNLARNWVMIPHVTQFDEADVTELEAFREEINRNDAGKSGVKVTLLAFILKALVAVLREYPEFNSSLDGDNLILKKYFHFGFAADTPNGLVVPVVHDVDRKGVFEIARETAELAAAARDGKLKLTDIQGGCITVSSLGGIGGTAFTPIINAPEVAVLGVSRLTHRPVYRDGGFVPRLMLPLSLSYDHRVIDGALAARFITRFSLVINDLRRALL